jgi:hypothetical protein
LQLKNLQKIPYIQDNMQFISVYAENGAWLTDMA